MNASHRREFLGTGLKAAGVLGLMVWTSTDSARAEGPADPAELAKKGVDFLRGRQAADGGWAGDRKEPGITALVVTALLRSKQVAPGDPVIARALATLEPFVGPKGGLSEAPHSVYTTSVALMAFQEANVGGRYDPLIKGSQAFLKDNQYDAGEGKGRDDPYFGGVGYGDKNSRPDLSNTAFLMEALHDSGLPPDDPAFQDALVFVSRCQNLKSEFNDQPWAGKVNDGGFLYTSGAQARPAAAKPDGDGTLRSAAGMTYAGLKSMIYAGLTRDDLRVKAALDYIRKNYTVEENPGQGRRGLYYYYQTLAKALAVLGEPTLVDAEGKAHDWRADLVAALAKRQEAGGGWVNHDDRFMEGDPNITTAFALLALASARPGAK